MKLLEKSDISISELEQVTQTLPKNILKNDWGFIPSWWPKLKIFIEEWLQEDIEVVILDKREQGGRELIEALMDVYPTEFGKENIHGLVTVGVAKNKTIARIAVIEAEVQQKDQYDSMSHQNNGILRIINK